MHVMWIKQILNHVETNSARASIQGHWGTFPGLITCSFKAVSGPWMQAGIPTESHEHINTITSCSASLFYLHTCKGSLSIICHFLSPSHSLSTKCTNAHKCFLNWGLKSIAFAKCHQFIRYNLLPRHWRCWPCHCSTHIFKCKPPIAQYGPSNKDWNQLCFSFLSEASCWSDCEVGCLASWWIPRWQGLRNDGITNLSLTEN